MESYLSETNKTEKNISKRVIMTCAFAFLSLFILFIVCNIISDNMNKYVDIAIGIALSVSAIFFHKRRKSFTYFICVILNSIGNGFCVSALFSHFEKEADMIKIAEGIIPATVFIGLIFVFSCFTKIKKEKIINVAFILNIFLIILIFIIWVVFDVPSRMIYMFLFFSFIISAGYLFVLTAEINEIKRNVMRDISWGSFGIFAFVTMIVIAIITGGEVIGEAVGGIFTPSDKKNK